MDTPKRPGTAFTPKCSPSGTLIVVRLARSDAQDAEQNDLRRSAARLLARGSSLFLVGYLE